MVLIYGLRFRPWFLENLRILIDRPEHMPFVCVSYELSQRLPF
jgi:hypothetical protein